MRELIDSRRDHTLSSIINSNNDAILQLLNRSSHIMKYHQRILLCVIYLSVLLTFSKGYRAIQGSSSTLCLKAKGFGKAVEESTKTEPISESPCFCGSGSFFKDCCSEILSKEAVLFETDLPAGKLVRGRYSAFSSRNADFIISTTHSAHEVYCSIWVLFAF
jgi:hypothetical protein